MATSGHLMVLSYDVTDNKARRKVAETVEEIGVRVQGSRIRA